MNDCTTIFRTGMALAFVTLDLHRYRLAEEHLVRRGDGHLDFRLQHLDRPRGPAAGPRFEIA